MPAEWSAHQGTFMSWPKRHNVWINESSPDGLIKAKLAYASVANAISEFEPVYMVTDAAFESEVKKLCSSNVKTLVMPHDDSWVRDNGPTFVVSRDKQIAGIKWQFNAWGEKYTPYDQDNLVASRILEHFKIQEFKPDIILEGGAIHVDGNGTLLTTAECVLNSNRNKNFTKEEFEKTVHDYLGVNKVIWLPYGLYGDETDGHIDNVACFTEIGKVVMQGTQDKSDPNYERTTDNLQILQNSHDASGKKLEVTVIKQPPTRFHNNERLTLSYINYYLVNGGLILPVFGHDAKKYDENAIDILKELFPNRKIVAIDGTEIIKGGGNIHCITQQMPQII